MTPAIFHYFREAARRGVVWDSWRSQEGEDISRKKERRRGGRGVSGWNKATDLKEIRSLPRTSDGLLQTWPRQVPMRRDMPDRRIQTKSASRRRRCACGLKLLACNRQERRNVRTFDVRAPFGNSLSARKGFCPVAGGCCLFKDAGRNAPFLDDEAMNEYEICSGTFVGVKHLRRYRASSRTRG